MFRKKKIHIILIILCLLVAEFLFIWPKQTFAADLDATKSAPGFTLTDIHGNALRLSDFKGKVILIDFWATWCPFCRESIPILKSLYNDYKDRGFEIMGIALEHDGGKTLKRFAKEKNITYPLAVGKERLAIEYSAHGVPTRILINRKGEIVEKFIGFQDKETIELAIKELL